MAVEIEKQGKVMTVILDRPEVKNAVDGPTAKQLADAFRTFDSDEEAHVAVLWGAHGTFCAGADLKAMARRENTNTVKEVGDGPMGPSRMVLSKPVIAAIAGHAVAGGFELACWCDLRVMEKTARMGQAARARVQRIFRWDEAAAGLVDVFEDTIRASYRRSRAA